jgi:uncharacterized damage-inducible protein DinB
VTGYELVEPPHLAGESDTLGGFLEFMRSCVPRKLAGLSPEQIRTPLPPSSLTLGGVVNHLAYCERWWFASVLAGEHHTYPWTGVEADDPDIDLRVPDGATAESLIELYLAECDRSRAIQARYALDASSEGRHRGEQYSARWIMTHLIEETGRHLGQMDLIRESIDGQVGE